MLEQLDDGFGLGLDGAGGGFLDQDVAILAVLESEEDQIDGLFERHNKTGHLGLSEGDRIPLTNLVNPERNNCSTGIHHVIITGAADLDITTHAAYGNGNLFFDGNRSYYLVLTTIVYFLVRFGSQSAPD